MKTTILQGVIIALSLFSSTSIAQNGARTAYLASEKTSSSFNNYEDDHIGLLDNEITIIKTGYANLFKGKLSGSNNNRGFFNSFFGSASGEKNTVGEMNSFFGTNAGNENSIGNHNSFFGATAGAQNTLGYGNSFFGATAGISNISGNSNSFFGVSAGIYNTTGYGNCFLGRESGMHNTSGSNNLFIGNKADATMGNINNAVAIGSGALVSVSNSVVLGNKLIAGWGFGTSPSKKCLIEFNPELTKTHLSKGGLWLEDRSAERFDNVSAVSSILLNLAQLNVLEWNLKNEPATNKHIGPTAENFNSIFKTNNESPNELSVGDLAGAAIQGVKELTLLVVQLQLENDLLKKRVSQLETKTGNR